MMLTVINSTPTFRTKVLVVLWMMTTDVWSTFCPVTSPFGPLAYFADVPTWKQTDVSLADCATSCYFKSTQTNGVSRCSCFTYNKTSSNCALHQTKPTKVQFDSTEQTMTYQLIDQPLSIWPTVSPKQCDIPYEYNGQLHNECRYEAPSASSKCKTGYFGCCLPDGTTAYCNPMLRTSGTPASSGSSTTFKYVDAQDCSYPYTHDGQLYYGCTSDVGSPVTNACHRAACKAINQSISRCKPPADFVARETNYTVSSTVTQQNDVNTLSVFGWISIMRRKVGSGDGSWNQNWATYQSGFGFTSTYLWLGLERMYKLTTTGNWRLRFEYQYQYNNKWVSAEYWMFTLGDKSQFYVIHVDGYSGDDTDRFRAGDRPGDKYNDNDRKFSAPNQDTTAAGCANYKGGWWFSECGLVFFTRPTPPAIYLQYVDSYIDVSEVHVLMKAR